MIQLKIAGGMKTKQKYTHEYVRLWKPGEVGMRTVEKV